MEPKIQIDKAQLASFCQEHHITKLALFGSVLTDRFGPESDVDVLFETDRFGPESDVDVLFEYDRDHIPTLFDVAGMEDELSAMLGRRVDMRTANDLSRYFRDEVVRTALVQYAA